MLVILVTTDLLGPMTVFHFMLNVLSYIKVCTCTQFDIFAALYSIIFIVRYILCTVFSTMKLLYRC